MPEGMLPGSFRDPSGFLLVRDGALLRQVNQGYKEDYDHLMASGLYRTLVDAGLLISHEEADLSLAVSDTAYKVLRPEVVPFVAYPYEWCFGQLKDAALATLDIQRQAMAHDMSLKDASAYNVQFVRGRPVLIDSLSFERYRAGEPWTAYRQFCQHFLAPLALMSFADVRLGGLLRAHIDGLPLDLASSLLPLRSRLNFGLLVHLHAHARSQQRYSAADVDRQSVRRQVSRHALLGLVESVRSTVEKLRWDPAQTAWADYYQQDSYETEGLAHKRQLVAAFVDEVRPGGVWDLGANTGLFSRVTSERGIPTVSMDFDPGSVEINYRQMVEAGESALLPLVIDLTNPSPAIGWENRERLSLLERGPVEMALALALIHHLAIANNLPLDRIAAFLAGLCDWLVIEFVPKADPKVRRLLSMREDIFPDYTLPGFEAAFGKLFEIRRSERIEGSERVLYLMEKRG